MRACAAALLAAVAALADPARAAEAMQGIDWNIDAVLESVYVPRSGAQDWTFEAALSLEVDLGEVAGLNNWYVFAHPTIAWGVEESYGWKARAYLAWLSWDGSEYWNVLGGLYDFGWHFQSLPSASVFTRLPGENTGSFSPSAIGLSPTSAGVGPGAPATAPVLNALWDSTPPVTRIGRGGQPALSTLLIQSRNAIRLLMSASLKFCLGIRRRCRVSS